MVRLALVLVPAVAYAEPRLVGTGDVGTWAQSQHEQHLGAEGDIEQAVSKHVWFGGGLDVQRVWYTDDECFGFHGWRGGAYATATLDLGDESAVHLLLGA